MQSQLPVLLAEYTFRTKSDMEDYLEILERASPPTLKAWPFMKKAFNAGLFMTGSRCWEIVDQCDAIMVPDLPLRRRTLPPDHLSGTPGRTGRGRPGKPEEEEFYISEKQTASLTTVVSPSLYRAPGGQHFPLPFRLRFPTTAAPASCPQALPTTLPAAQKYRQLLHLEGNPGPLSIRSQFQNLFTRTLQALVETYWEQTGTGTITLG